MSKMPLKMQRRFQRGNGPRTRLIQHICLHAVSVSLLLLTLLKKIVFVIKIVEDREKKLPFLSGYKITPENRSLRRPSGYQVLGTSIIKKDCA